MIASDASSAAIGRFSDSQLAEPRVYPWYLLGVGILTTAKTAFHKGTALRETPWETREFAFFDPDQNGLTFYCDLEEA